MGGTGKIRVRGTDLRRNFRFWCLAIKRLCARTYYSKANLTKKYLYFTESCGCKSKYVIFCAVAACESEQSEH